MARRTAVITGASTGIGAATARELSRLDFDVVVGARRLDLLEEVAKPIGASALALDVTDSESIDHFCSQIAHCDVLVNNAGGAIGLESVAEGSDDKWDRMYELNVLSVLRMTKHLLPRLLESGDGQIVNLGSVASRFVYEGGGGYTAAKHALRAVSQTLRGELLGKPIRVTEIEPGMVKTDFSLVRFEGDQEKAEAVYENVDALTPEDIAECVGWVVTRPSHVNIDELMVTPRAQVLGFGQTIVRSGSNE